MDTVSLYLPLNTWVHVQAFTNAAFLQQVTITYEDGSSVVLTGSGEHDAPMPNGDFGFTTPSSSRSPLGWRTTVQVQSDHDGTWVPSKVQSGGCNVATYYSLAMVVSEDYVDGDWNDAVVLFTWWTPPSLRDVADLHLERRSAQ